MIGVGSGAVTMYTGDLQGAEFIHADLSSSRFRLAELAGVVMRGVNLAGADIDGEIDGLRINGVEVGPLVEAELARREPGRALRDATDPAGLQAAWAALEETWAATYDRVAAMPEGTAELSVDGEWSFAQTLRHLVFATDGWLRLAIFDDDNPFHPWGLPFMEFLGYASQLGVDLSATPAYQEVRKVRADRVAMVRDFLASATPERLAEICGAPPWEGDQKLDVLTCLRVIIDEEWEHHRFAVRDLDLIEAGSPLVDRPVTWSEVS
jgi:DinB superfamily/Pentapeptide repeats (8 copies)